MSGILISYARADDKTFVKKLRQKLVKHGFDVWRDKEDMDSCGRTFLHEIQDAIYDSDKVIAVIGPKALESRYVWYEWQYAYLHSKVLVPILRKGLYNSLSEKKEDLLCRDSQKYPNKLSPSELAKHHIIDFRKGQSQSTAFNELRRILSRPIKAPGVLLTDVPELPAHFLPRCEDLSILSKLVISDSKNLNVIKSTKRVTALCGRGGIGKSVVSAAFAHSVSTRRAFDDGIVWLNVGQKPNSRRLLATLGRDAFNDDPVHYADPDTAMNALESVLKDKECLLILDDVWDCNHVQMFYNNLGPRCRLLFTTRNRELAIKLGAQTHTLQVLDDRDALQLLGDRSGNEVSSLPPEAITLAKKCDRLPFALSQCGALAGSGQPWSDILDALLEVDRTVLKDRFPGWEGEVDAFTPLEIALDFLKGMDDQEMEDKAPRLEHYQHYLDLAVLPSGEGTPESVVMTLWLNRNGLKEQHLRKILTLLKNMELLQLDGELPLSKVRLHNLQRFYLQSLVRDLAHLHKVLGKALLAWWEEHKLRNTEGVEKQMDSYIMDHLFSHLMEAEQWDDLKELLTDLEYLKRKQQPLMQFDFRTDFLAFLENPKAPLEKILQGLHTVILEKLPLGKKKADWLDTFAYWVDTAAHQADRKRQSILKEIANRFDSTCGEVSRKLVRVFLDEGQVDWAMRFAELHIWVYQRAEYYQKCVDACTYAENQCSQTGIEDAYLSLVQTEFTRLRALAQTKLSEKESDQTEKMKHETKAREAYEMLNKSFSKTGEMSWKLTVQEWKQFEIHPVSKLYPLSQQKSDIPGFFHAKVVSNEHDCISAMHIIQFFEKRGGLVEWMHHKDFKPYHLATEDALVVVLIGGPKTPDLSEVAHKFFEVDKDRYLRMYSGLYFEAHRLQTTVGGTHYYMLGGISKVNTLKAAYEFTKDDEVTEIVEMRG